jgi:uncharacterized protein YjiS (DUF1127 family)
VDVEDDALRRETLPEHIFAFARTAAHIYRTWARRVRERRELAHWSDRDLQDISATRCDVAFEIEKPFWKK